MQEKIQQIYEEIRGAPITGNVASYIPELAKVNPGLFAVSIVTMDGKTYNFGDGDNTFCLQSAVKPFSYCIAQKLNGPSTVHEYIGQEPSGRKFNEFCVNDDGKPHNSLINAGAIATCSLIEPKAEPAKRFDTVLSNLKDMCGHAGNLGYDNSVYLSEKHHASRNFALAYYLQDNDAFPKGTSIPDTLDLYFQTCSITTNTKTLAMMAATLANDGVCPLTGQEVFSHEIVKNTLSVMLSCGMYDFSGTFGVKVGVSAKSAVSGFIFFVIPGKMAGAVVSPPLDKYGNSIKGVEFLTRLSKELNLHIQDQFKHSKLEIITDFTIISLAHMGELEQLRKIAKNRSLQVADYDKRTPLHLAAAEGHLEVVKFLLECGCEKKYKDRNGNTPYHEAFMHIDEGENFKEICKILQDNNGEHLSGQTFSHTGPTEKTSPENSDI